MSTPKKKIRFLIDVQVEAQGTIDFEARAGEVKELSAASANRWLRRGAATTDIEGSETTEVAKPAEPVERKQNEPITATSDEPEVEEEEKPSAPAPKKRTRRSPVKAR